MPLSYAFGIGATAMSLSVSLIGVFFCHLAFRRLTSAGGTNLGRNGKDNKQGSLSFNLLLTCRAFKVRLVVGCQSCWDRVRGKRIESLT